MQARQQTGMQFQKNISSKSPYHDGEDNEDTNDDDDSYNCQNRQIIPGDFLLEGWSLKTLPREPFRPKGTRPFVQVPIQSKRPMSLRKYELFKNSPRNNFQDTAMMLSQSSFGIPCADTIALDKLNSSIHGLLDTSKGQITQNCKTQGYFKENNGIDTVERTQTDCYYGVHTNRQIHRKIANCVFSARPIKSENAENLNHQEDYQEFIGKTSFKTGFANKKQFCPKITNNSRNTKADQEKLIHRYRYLSLDEQVQLAERNKTDHARSHNSRSNNDVDNQDNEIRMRETLRLKLSVKNREMSQTKKQITHRASSSQKQSADKENNTNRDQCCEKDRLEKQIKLISYKQTQWNQLVAFHLKHSMIPAETMDQGDDRIKDRHGEKNSVSINSFVTQQKQQKQKMERQLGDKCLTNVTQDGRCLSPLETAPTMSSRVMKKTKRRISTTNGNERETVIEDGQQKTCLKIKHMEDRENEIQSNRRRQKNKNVLEYKQEQGQAILDANRSRLQCILNTLNIENTAQIQSSTHKRIVSHKSNIQSIYCNGEEENAGALNEISVLSSKRNAQVKDQPGSGLAYPKRQIVAGGKHTKLPLIIPAVQIELQTERDQQQQQQGHHLLQFYQPKIILKKPSAKRVSQRGYQDSWISQDKLDKERQICSQSLPQTFRQIEKVVN